MKGKTVECELGGCVTVRDSTMAVELADIWVSQHTLALTPKDVGRLIAALSRTKAARAARRRATTETA